MFGFITRRISDWNQLRRERYIRNLTEEMARYQRRIRNIYQQLIIYSAEYAMRAYMRCTGGETEGDDIRLIILENEIRHLPLQKNVYNHTVRNIQERLQRLQRSQITTPPIINEHDAVIVACNE
jgi:hypothetical protein